ncbi:MAG: DNA mismatch repair endonuclease MutL [Spirochaetia bacterium]|jgi:DNA mismatch repair protein MutL|nr:DNA mismatch repair endonuclease MutL [Spirochaetia bacterium]
MKIHQLNPLVAQRIAAGEVIERPASVTRELLDNAIDAGAGNISLVIKEGGLQEITVIDDGCGIAGEDLPLCCKSHSTSKITDLDDLYHIHSMGFRGEALYSIAAVSKITISSNYQGEGANTFIVDNGAVMPVTKGGPDHGTRITVEDLFGQIPARRQFLKRPSSEASLCRSVMVEKAMAFPGITFRYYNEDRLLLTLEAADQKQRVCDALAGDYRFKKEEVLEMEAAFPRYSLKAIAASPLVRRTDRSQIKIFVNNRPINSYPLIQAVTYGYGELLPGGSFPYCYLFITIDPELVDFNIHPTKREVKIRIQAEVHHSITQMIKTQMIRPIPAIEEGKQNLQGDFGFEGDTKETARKTWHEWTAMHGTAKEHAPGYHTSAVSEEKPKNPDWFDKAKQILAKPAVPEQAGTHPDLKNQGMATGQTTQSSPNPEEKWQENDTASLRYIGQAFNLFLIVEKGNELYLIDQHAAHERILFDQIRNHRGSQRLLVPYGFDVEPDVDTYLETNSDLYASLGIELARKEPQQWELKAVPTMYRPVESQVVEFIKNNTGSMEAIEKGLFAIIACKSAIKQGETITETSAKELVEQVFRLEEPCCPHGRTFLIRLQKDELAKMVGRT